MTGFMVCFASEIDDLGLFVCPKFRAIYGLNKDCWWPG